MKYFHSEKENHLIQYYPAQKIYRIRNKIDGNQVINEEEFNLLNAKQVKKQFFCEKMNDFFKDVKHKWVHKGTNFRKLDNFDSENKHLDKTPRHYLSYAQTIFVYHWGKVYYMIIDGNTFPHGQLYCLNTKQLTNRWVNIKNVAPVFNVDTKQII